MDDHCSALAEILARGRAGEGYCIGGDNQRTNLDVAQSVCAVLDALAPKPAGSYLDQVALVPDRRGHDRRYAIDASKVRRELGWNPEFKFDNASHASVAWYVENAECVARIREGRYRDWQAECG